MPTEPRNGSLQTAKNRKNDEFYTLPADIEAELAHYREHFRGKTVYCNCDDPDRSAFVSFLREKFADWEIGKLIATWMRPDGIGGYWSMARGGSGTAKQGMGAGAQGDAPDIAKQGMGAEDETRDGGGDITKQRRRATEETKDGAAAPRVPDDVDEGYAVERGVLESGDFRSGKCRELLESADIVVTNPPFSLFREYIVQLAASGKKFLIIGTLNMITYKEVFPLIRDDRMWLGYTQPKRFLEPGGGIRGFGNCLWFTNLDIPKRHSPIGLTSQYYGNEGLYPVYANYDALEVPRVSMIPGDYVPCWHGCGAAGGCGFAESGGADAAAGCRQRCSGAMGVPVSYLHRHCDSQFEIIGAGTSRDFFTPTIKFEKPIRHNMDGTTTKQHIAVNQTLTLGWEEPPEKGYYITAENTDLYLTSPYDRLLIRRIGPDGRSKEREAG